MNWKYCFFLIGTWNSGLSDNSLVASVGYWELLSWNYNLNFSDYGDQLLTSMVSYLIKWTQYCMKPTVLDFGCTILWFRTQVKYPMRNTEAWKKILAFHTFLLLSTCIWFEGVATTVEGIFWVFIFIQDTSKADLPLISVPVQLRIQTKSAALQVLPC